MASLAVPFSFMRCQRRQKREVKWLRSQQIDIIATMPSAIFCIHSLYIICNLFWRARFNLCHFDCVSLMLTLADVIFVLYSNTHAKHAFRVGFHFVWSFGRLAKSRLQMWNNIISTGSSILPSFLLSLRATRDLTRLLSIRIYV